MITRFYVTEAGQRLYAKAQTGVPMTFTHMEVGSGRLPLGASPEAVTELLSSVKTLELTKCVVSNSVANISTQFTNEGIIDAFEWNEIGLFANDPDDGEILYGYGYEENTPITVPPYTQSTVSFLYTIQSKVGNATDVTVVVNPEQVFVTEKELAQKLEDQRNALLQATADSFSKFVFIGDKEPAAGPVFWFDTSKRESNTLALSLEIGGEDDEAPVGLSVDGEEYPIMNLSEPTTENGIYVIQVTD